MGSNKKIKCHRSHFAKTKWKRKCVSLPPSCHPETKMTLGLSPSCLSVVGALHPLSMFKWSVSCPPSCLSVDGALCPRSMFKWSVSCPLSCLSVDGALCPWSTFKWSVSCLFHVSMWLVPCIHCLLWSGLCFLSTLTHLVQG